MRIGIDCRMWNETGVGRYIRNIVLGISKVDTVNEYILYFRKPEFESLSFPSNFKKVCADVRWHSLKEQFLMPYLYYRSNLNLLHVPHFNVPILYFGRFVVTIHDITVLKVRTGRATTLPYPIYLLKYVSAFFAYLNAVKRSLHVFTVSNFVADELSSFFKIKKDRISVFPCASESTFTPKKESEVDIILTKYKISKPYLFYIGNASPHKNLETLVKAFERVLVEYPKMQLVLAGKKDFFYQRLENECAKLPFALNILFPGFISDSDLPFLYCGAEAFVNPSMYEGFGIQTLEAYACGCKVACSNTTSLPEVGGSCAWYFSPTNSSEMAERILDCIRSDSKDYIECGRKVSENFSWKKTAFDVHSYYLSIGIGSK